MLFIFIRSSTISWALFGAAAAAAAAAAAGATCGPSSPSLGFFPSVSTLHLPFIHAPKSGSEHPSDVNWTQCMLPSAYKPRALCSRSDN
jgi:hypothetical protein